MSPERERIDADVLVIGAGPAGLACAIRLARLAAEAGEAREVVVVEKGSEAGQHILSGAVMDPRGAASLFGSGWKEAGFPVEAEVTSDSVWYLTRRRKFRFPFTPPTLRNEGHHLVVLSRVVQWMRDRAAAEGVGIFEGFPVSEPILEGERVVGAITADRGLDRAGRPKPGFAPGTEIRAKVTVLAEGTRGSITKILIHRLGLSGKNPQTYGLGLKEVWELPPGRVRAGEVHHTAGWPLGASHYGGGWLYGLPGDRVSIGFVPALDYRDPRFDPHEAMQAWKTHPFIRGLLAGGKLIQAGAKTVPEGGLWSQPHLWGDGFVIVGDAGSFLNAPRLKGIHTALESGRLAAEAIHLSLKAGRADGESLSVYGKLYRESWLWKELWGVRNVRQAFGGGFFPGVVRAGLLLLTGGRLARDPLPVRPDHSHLRKLAELGALAERPSTTAESAKSSAARGADGSAAPSAIAGGARFRPDGITVDKLTSTFLSGTLHDENQPSHLIVLDPDICATRCVVEYGNPCQHFCPARVYEMVDDPEKGPGARKLHINHANCVHCKTCDIMDPYEIINWTVPSDAGGPRYLGL